ncbi:MAG: ComF family protein [Stappiaceae bacterium]
MTVHNQKSASRPHRESRAVHGKWRIVSEKLLDFILPWQCPGCRRVLKDGGGLCPHCWKELHFIERPYCERLGIPFAYDLGSQAECAQAIANPPAFDRARAAVAFGPVAQRMVHDLKYRDRLDLVSLMAGFMLRAGQDFVEKNPLLVPVPLHRSRLVKRRFNQSAILAEKLADKMGLTHCPQLLLRSRKTRQQVGLDITERQTNVRGAFNVPVQLRPKLSGRRIVLVDDVLTTGATVDACSKVLKRAGASGVDVLTFARVLPSEEILPA